MAPRFSKRRPSIRVSVPLSRLQGLFGPEKTPMRQLVTPLPEDLRSILDDEFEKGTPMNTCLLQPLPPPPPPPHCRPQRPSKRRSSSEVWAPESVDNERSRHSEIGLNYTAATGTIEWHVRNLLPETSMFGWSLVDDSSSNAKRTSYDTRRTASIETSRQTTPHSPSDDVFRHRLTEAPLPKRNRLSEVCGGHSPRAATCGDEEEEEYRRRLCIVEYEVTKPYHSTRPTCDGDPRGRRGYTTCGSGVRRPTTLVGTAEGEDGRREQLRRLVTDPTARECLFVNAVVRNNVCYGFAAATTNTLIEEKGSTPYNVLTKAAVDSHHTGNWRRSSVRPRDIVRFAVNNTATPVTIVGCDFDQLLTTAGGGSFFEDFCRLEKLSVDMLAETDGEEWCKACFPTEKRRGDYVSDDGLFLYCQSHASALAQYGADLLLYRPTLVSVSANDTRVWLSTVDRTSDDTSSHLTFFELPKKEVVKAGKFFHDDGVLLVRIARDWKMPWTGGESSSPVNVVTAMQYLCTRLLAKTGLCPKSESMGPPSSVKVNRPGI